MISQIAIISDIHGNIPALEVVMADIAARGIETIYCLGDLVGKGPNSAECIDIVREKCDKVVKGNWDDFLESAPHYTTVQRMKPELGAERIAYLKDLPHTIDFQMSGRQVRLYHASQKSVHKTVNPFEAEHVERVPAMFTNTEFTGFEHPEPTVVGYGDIHIAFYYSPETFKLLFNCGSVGNPADDNKATYAIMNGVMDGSLDDDFNVEIIRLSYDIERAVALAAHLHDIEQYADELRYCKHRGSYS